MPAAKLRRGLGRGADSGQVDLLVLDCPLLHLGPILAGQDVIPIAVPVPVEPGVDDHGPHDQVRDRHLVLEGRGAAVGQNQGQDQTVVAAVQVRPISRHVQIVRGVVVKTQVRLLLQADPRTEVHALHRAVVHRPVWRGPRAKDRGEGRGSPRIRGHGLAREAVRAVRCIAQVPLGRDLVRTGDHKGQVQGLAFIHVAPGIGQGHPAGSVQADGRVSPPKSAQCGLEPWGRLQAAERRGRDRQPVHGALLLNKGLVRNAEVELDPLAMIVGLVRTAGRTPPALESVVRGRRRVLARAKGPGPEPGAGVALRHTLGRHVLVERQLEFEEVHGTAGQTDVQVPRKGTPQVDIPDGACGRAQEVVRQGRGGRVDVHTQCAVVRPLGPVHLVGLAVGPFAWRVRHLQGVQGRRPCRRTDRAHPEPHARLIQVSSHPHLRSPRLPTGTPVSPRTRCGRASRSVLPSRTGASEVDREMSGPLGAPEPTMSMRTGRKKNNRKVERAPAARTDRAPAQ